MKIELDVELREKDLLAFNFYHTYKGSQGITSILLAIIVFVVVGLTIGKVEPYWSVIYAAVGVLTLLYVPFTLRAKVKQTIKRGQSYGNKIHYVFDENGITTSVGETSVTLEWNLLYKIVGNKKFVLVYQTRQGANVIARDQLGDNYNALYELAKSKVDEYRFKMKKDK